MPSDKKLEQKRHENQDDTHLHVKKIARSLSTLPSNDAQLEEARNWGQCTGTRCGNCTDHDINGLPADALCIHERFKLVELTPQLISGILNVRTADYARQLDVVGFDESVEWATGLRGKKFKNTKFTFAEGHEDKDGKTFMLAVVLFICHFNEVKKGKREIDALGNKDSEMSRVWKWAEYHVKQRTLRKEEEEERKKQDKPYDPYNR